PDDGLDPWRLAGPELLRDATPTACDNTYKALHGDPQGRPTGISKLNTLCQILYLLVVVGTHAMQRPAPAALTTLGAVVFVTTVVSGIDYVLTYSRKAAEVRRARRGAD